MLHSRVILGARPQLILCWLLLDPDVDGQNASNIVGNLSLIVSEEYSLILKESQCFSVCGSNMLSYYEVLSVVSLVE